MLDQAAATTLHPDLTDAEVDAICDGYKQNAARVRYLRSLGLHVERKPNGRPLVNREHYNRVRGGRPTEAAPAISPKWKVAA